MMLYPPVADLDNKIGSRYLLVNLVAKRARKIAAEAENEGEPLTKKPVSSAIDEVYTGKLSVNNEVPLHRDEEEKSEENKSEDADDIVIE